MYGGVKNNMVTVIPLIILFALFAWLIFILSLWKNDYMIGFIAGAFIIVIGVYSFIYGIGSLNDWLTRAFGYVHIGIGIIICALSGLEQIQEW